MLFELMGEAVWITAVTPVLMLVEVKYKLTIKLPRERLINYHEIEYERNRYLEEMARIKSTLLRDHMSGRPNQQDLPLE